MKIIHTGDWHLGQSLHGLDREWEHALFLDWLLGQVRCEEPNLLLIAGDVFDSPNPPASASRLYYRFLAQLAGLERRPQVIIIAGNHDSASRLEAPSELLEQLDIQVRGVVKRKEDGGIDYDHFTIPLHGGGACLAVPYLRQGDFSREGGYAEGMRAFYQGLTNSVSTNLKPLIAMGHLHVAGGIEMTDDRSERRIVGGLEFIPLDAFSDRLDYVALGHLHRGQCLGCLGKVRYAGAPLPMSFTEEHYSQGVYLIQITDCGLESKLLSFTAPLQLMTIGPASKVEVLSTIGKLPDLPKGTPLAQDTPLLRVLVELTQPEPSLRAELEEALEGKCARLVIAQPIYPYVQVPTEKRSLEQLESATELEVACNAYEEVYASHMPSDMKQLLMELITEVQEEGV